MPRRQSVSAISLLVGLVLIVITVVRQRGCHLGSSTATENRPVVPGSFTVHFSPHGGCTEAVVQELKEAKKTIFVQAYSFTSAPIAGALVEAHRRGVAITVLLDKSNLSERYSSADFVSHAGIPTFIDAVHSIAHNKIMIIDGATVITGSFNFTKNAEESNAENLLVIHSPELAAQYQENWEAHRRHSEAYTGQGKATSGRERESRFEHSLF